MASNSLTSFSFSSIEPSGKFSVELSSDKLEVVLSARAVTAAPSLLRLALATPMSGDP